MESNNVEIMFDSKFSVEAINNKKILDRIMIISYRKPFDWKIEILRSLGESINYVFLITLYSQRTRNAAFKFKIL